MNLWRWHHPWQWRVQSWKVPQGTIFDHNGFIAYLEKRLNVTFKDARAYTTEPNLGGTWVGGGLDGLSLSAYMHPTKSQSACFYCGGFLAGKVLPENRVIAEPGWWAVAFGNYTCHEFWDYACHNVH